MGPLRMTPEQWGRAFFAMGGEPAELDRKDLRAAAGRPLGRQNELLVVEALRSVEPRPWWIYGVRKALPEEDVAGIDVVVLSRDAGALYLQVKSSRRNVQRWMEDHPER